MCDHQPREASMMVLRHDDTGRPSVWCDPCIAPLIDALNARGLPTVWSCCGHGNRPGMVGLTDGRQLMVLPDPEAAHRVEHELRRLYPLTSSGQPLALDLEAPRG